MSRDGSDAESRFPLFFSLLRTLVREKRSENCLRIGTGGPNLFLSFIVPKYTCGRSRRRDLAESNLHYVITCQECDRGGKCACPT